MYEIYCPTSPSRTSISCHFLALYVRRDIILLWNKGFIFTTIYVEAVDLLKLWNILHLKSIIFKVMGDLSGFIFDSLRYIELIHTTEYVFRTLYLHWREIFGLYFYKNVVHIYNERQVDRHNLVFKRINFVGNWPHCT